jgi:hypothetical protein
MLDNIGQDEILDFQKVIQYDLELYLSNYNYFIQNLYPSILSYFEGSSDDINTQAFQILNKLTEQSTILSNIIYTLKEKFKKLSDRVIVDFLEDIKINLITISNTSKFTRSPRTKDSYNTSLEYNYLLKQGETLEEVAKDQLNNIEDWEDIAWRNNIRETDYTVEGGNNLVLSKQKNGVVRLFLNSVVDNLNGEKLLGRDIVKKITIVDDVTNGGDLQTLTYRDTFQQSVLILSQLEQGDIPERPYLGKAKLIGKNMAVFIFNGIKKQLDRTFQSDDTIVDFNVTNFRYQGGDLFYDYTVQSFYDKIHKQNGAI